MFGNYSLSSLKSAPSNDLSSNGYKSGGYNSALIDNDGKRYLIYHTRFNTGNEYHQVRVHQQFLNEDKCPVTAVYEYLGSEISQNGYSKDEITGTYDFVNHGLDATTGNIGMLKTSKISLNNDGTYYIKNVSSGLYLDVANGSSADGANIQQWGLGRNDSQKFKIVSDGNGEYHILTGASNYNSCIDIVNGNSANGTNIDQWKYWGGDGQLWRLTKAY